MGMRDLVGVPTRFTISAAGPGAVAFLVLGLSNLNFAGGRLPHSLAPVGFPGVLLQASPDVCLFTLAGAAGIQSGYARIDVPMHFSATGTPVYAQWLWFDPSNPSLHGSTLGHSFRVR
jgi:hypothetical protein